MKIHPLSKLSITLIIFISALTYSQVKDPEIVKDKVSPSVKSFDLNEVKLLDGPFKKAMELVYLNLLKSRRN